MLRTPYSKHGFDGPKIKNIEFCSAFREIYIGFDVYFVL